MTKIDIKKNIESLIDTFFYAGKISLDLRKKGLIKKVKSDDTPVTNGDLEVNKIITKKINEITPNIPIISEETVDIKKSNKDLGGLIQFLVNDIEMDEKRVQNGVKKKNAGKNLLIEILLLQSHHQNLQILKK